MVRSEPTWTGHRNINGWSNLKAEPFKFGSKPDLNQSDPIRGHISCYYGIDPDRLPPSSPARWFLPATAIWSPSMRLLRRGFPTNPYLSPSIRVALSWFWAPSLLFIAGSRTSGALPRTMKQISGAYQSSYGDDEGGASFWRSLVALRLSLSSRVGCPVHSRLRSGILDRSVRQQDPNPSKRVRRIDSVPAWIRSVLQVRPQVFFSVQRFRPTAIRLRRVAPSSSFKPSLFLPSVLHGGLAISTRLDRNGAFTIILAPIHLAAFRSDLCRSFCSPRSSWYTRMGRIRTLGAILSVLFLLVASVASSRVLLDDDKVKSQFFLIFASASFLN